MVPSHVRRLKRVVDAGVEKVEAMANGGVDETRRDAQTVAVSPSNTDHHNHTITLFLPEPTVHATSMLKRVDEYADRSYQRSPASAFRTYDWREESM